ncbi:hypothetical protein B0H13DRAFT_1903628 [Mycena leptocephala]|nr:hypothetical protein B0H13DRAFT_1903628 [Mycena leptocephala]
MDQAKEGGSLQEHIRCANDSSVQVSSPVTFQSKSRDILEGSKDVLAGRVKYNEDNFRIRFGFGSGSLSGTAKFKPMAFAIALLYAPSASILLPCSGTQNAIDVHNRENTSIDSNDGIGDAASNWVGENEDRSTENR